ncbi:nucleotide-diphospho-sugar transferase, partial [Pilaira anomala]
MQSKTSRPAAVAHPNRVKAAFVILARNSDLSGIRKSIREMEDRFNGKFNYPYVFLNEETFTDEFKEKTSELTNSPTHYGKIDKDMWGYPSHINQTKAAECRKDLQDRDVIYGGSESYRHMCRFQSGFFFRHPLLDAYEYYWRVEPDVHYYCDIDYDVFQMMKDKQLKYGWTLSLTEYMATIPTLWETTKSFMAQNEDLINRSKDGLLSWLTDDGFETYNGCHFWSNFEIGSLDFFRSERYLKFFDHLDATGGFFYERWGDAPVHSLAVAMMLKQSEVHFFNDIGYMHNPLQHCPTEPWIHKKCSCEQNDNFDWTGWSCLTRYSKLAKDFIWDESTHANMTKPYRIQA